MKNIVIILAGGSGSRLGSELPKQYLTLSNATILETTIRAFINHPRIDGIQVVINPQDLQLYNNISSNFNLLPVTYGGETRQESAKFGLIAIEPHNPQLVFIHDAARPFVTASLIDKLLDNMSTSLAIIPVSKVVDAMKKVKDSYIMNTIERNDLYAAQTPQLFDYQTIKQLHLTATDEIALDDAYLCELHNIPIKTVEMDNSNFKITTEFDLKKAKMITYNYQETRVGIGFDAHKFIKQDGNNFIILGGITIDHEFSIDAHSDGDLVLHALVDAMLGAIGEGDIGLHFPPTELKWKKSDSAHFVKYSNTLIKEKNATLINVDITIIGEKPHIAPYRNLMKQNIAKMLEIDITRVNIKATTTEKMGFTGRKEGLASQAIVSIKI